MNQKLHEAMVNFQYLEFMLQGAIMKFESILRDKVSYFFIYQVDEKEINKMGLSKLAEKYSIYTGDKSFKQRVDSVVNSRNRLAHALFIKAEHMKDDLGEGLQQTLEETLKHSEEAESLANEVIMRMQHIYFDPHENIWVKD